MVSFYSLWEVYCRLFSMCLLREEAGIPHSLYSECMDCFMRASGSHRRVGGKEEGGGGGLAGGGCSNTIRLSA